MTKIHKRRIRKWVEALRSGKYEQGKHALRRKDRFCCLGVACDLYRKATKDGRWVKPDSDGDYEFLDMAGCLPQVVADWLGVDDLNPKLSVGRRGEDSLANHNDAGARFPAIANAIERTYLKDDAA